MKPLTSMEKTLQEQLEGYVFDEDRILRRVPFAQFLTKQQEFGVGLLLPKDREDNNGNVHQEWVPVVVTSARTFHPVFQGENRALGVRFDGIPAELPRRYSLVVVPSWLHAVDPVPEARALYDAIRNAYRETLYFREPWYAVHAIWDLSTYFFGLFPAFPYLELRGVKGAAKTKVMQQSACFSFNASPILSSPSEASLFRTVHDQRPTLYLDEAENLFRVVKGKVEHDGRVEVINSGYTAEGRVPRVEKVGSKFVTMHYATYCPKMLASIGGLYGATESRAILHVMTRAPDNDKRGEREVDKADPRFQRIRDQLFHFMLGRWKEVKAAYDALETGNGLKKRDLQLWRPLLAVARVIGSDVEQELLAVAEHQQELSRAEDITEGSWEYLLLERAYALLKGGQRVLYLADLVDAIPVEQRPHNNKALGRLLDGLGFRDFERQQHPDTRRAGYLIPSIEDFERILGTLNPSFFSSFPSGSFDHRRENEEEEIIEPKESRRKEPYSEGNSPKETKETKETKAVYDSEHPLAVFLTQAENGRAYPVEAVAKLSGLTPEATDTALAAAAQRGEVYSPRPGLWGVLK